MTIAARYNLQRGIPENKQYEHTTYSPESAVDRYIMAKVDSRRMILDIKNYDDYVRSAGEDIAKAAENEIDKLLDTIK